MNLGQFWRIAAFCIAVIGSLSATGQSLTLEQRTMLNQLPPAQRQQALDAIRAVQTSRIATPTSSPEPDGEEVPPVLETVEQIEILPTAEPFSRLILTFDLDTGLSEQQGLGLPAQPLLQQLRGSRVYTLDQYGNLLIDGLPKISLSGLTEEDIEQRLAAERLLAAFLIEARILGRDPSTSDSLLPFGYDVFGEAAPDYDATEMGPVSNAYVLGPGDSIRIQFFGNVNSVFETEVTRDGVLNVAELGPLVVAGMSFEQFRDDIEKRARETLIGTEVSVSVGQIRRIRIFVLGDVNQPGSVVVSSLSAVSGAVLASGGISKNGSLRAIQLKRGGTTIARLDLYDLLLRGDTSGDVRLQPGDSIFVPPVGPQVTIDGAVKRPGIYEIRAGTTVQNGVSMAGGYRSDAFPSGARLERIVSRESRQISALDLATSSVGELPLADGDSLYVPAVLGRLDNAIALTGDVHRPGNYEYQEGMRLADLLPSLRDLKATADGEYILVRRRNQNDHHLSVVSANLIAALHDPGSEQNIALSPGDRVFVFSLSLGRQHIVAPILEELKLQSRRESPLREVSISGGVRAPGRYPMEDGMRVSDLIRAGGSLAEEAYTQKAEIVRYSTGSGESREVQVIDVDLSAILRGDAHSDLTLAEHDNLRVSAIPEWDTLWSVTIEGEVQFPGIYRIKRGDTLGGVLARAGGLSPSAFPDGAVFLRSELRAREEEQIDMLVRRLEADLASLSLRNKESSGETISAGSALLDQLKNAEPLGRLVIDLKSLVNNAAGSGVDVELRDGDRLLIPKVAQEVTVIGETQQNTSHLFGPELSRDDYIDLSGGMTRRADKQLIYIVRASGAVHTSGRSRWFGRGKRVEIRPGDTIVVPLAIDRIRPLTFWGNVTQILYQGAIAVAAVRTFDNN